MRAWVWIGSILNLCSIALLIPGLTRPLLTIEASISLFGMAPLTLLQQSRSILDTIDILYRTDYNFVATLILLFSVAIPVVKAVLVMVALLLRQPWQYRVHWFIATIGKWSMADVFVGAALVAYLSADATDNMAAGLEVGFYYFTAYCLCSLAAIQIIMLASHRLYRQQREQSGSHEPALVMPS